MKRHWIVPALFAMVCTGCGGDTQPVVSSPSGPDPVIQQRLPGAYRSLLMRSRIHSAKNTHQDIFFEATEQNWVKELKNLPTIMDFNPDGTYVQHFRKPDSTIQFIVQGSWTLSGDSITLFQTSPGSVIIKYKVSLLDSIVRFEGITDFDSDGEKDDEYLQEILRTGDSLSAAKMPADTLP